MGVSPGIRRPGLVLFTLFCLQSVLVPGLCSPARTAPSLSSEGHPKNQKRNTTAQDFQKPDDLLGSESFDVSLPSKTRRLLRGTEPETISSHQPAFPLTLADDIEDLRARAKKWSFPRRRERRTSGHSQGPRAHPHRKSASGIFGKELRDRRSIRKNGRQPGILVPHFSTEETGRPKRLRPSGSLEDTLMSDYPEELLTLVMLLRESVADGTVEDLLQRNPWIAQFATPDILALIASLDEDEDEDEAHPAIAAAGTVEDYEGEPIFGNNQGSGPFTEVNDDDQEQDSGTWKRGALAANQLYSALRAVADDERDSDTRSRLWRTAAQQLGFQGQQDGVYSLARKLERDGADQVFKRHH